MKVVTPSPLLVEATEVLAPFQDHVAVVGATALEVALADVRSAILTPTRDVDVVVPVAKVADIVTHLEKAELRRSEEPHERAFTWVRGDLKIQLVRTFHPFPKSPAKELPDNPVFGIASDPAHQTLVAFADQPQHQRLRCANAACLLALKQAAFGREKADGTPVERDFHDAYLLVSTLAEEIADELRSADLEVRSRAVKAIAELGAGGGATIAAGRQVVRLDASHSQRTAEAAVVRAAGRMQRRLGALSVS